MNTTKATVNALITAAAEQHGGGMRLFSRLNVDSSAQQFACDYSVE